MNSDNISFQQKFDLLIYVQNHLQFKEQKLLFFGGFQHQIIRFRDRAHVINFYGSSTVRALYTAFISFYNLGS